MKQPDFYANLRSKIDTFCHEVYTTTRTFPKDEMFGLTSQLRRATLSVALNFIEGYARGKGKTNNQFLRYAYGSLQESKYPALKAGCPQQVCSWL